MSYGFGQDSQYPPDWMCITCGHVNFAKRAVCEQCQGPRTQESPPAFAPTHASVRAGAVPPTAAAGFGPYGGYKGGMRPPPAAFGGPQPYPQAYNGGRQPAVLMPGDWCCPNPTCGHLNFAKRLECQMCRTPKNYAGSRGYAYEGSQYPPDWRCLQCDNINFARRQECKQCNAPRTANSPPTHVSQQYQPDWRCTTCGNINFSRRTECKQCGKPRTPDAPDAYAPNHAALKASQQLRGLGIPKAVTVGPGDWNCMSCGFMNFARRTECLQCKAERALMPGPPGVMDGSDGAFPQYAQY